MERRLVDLELKGYEEELTRRNQTLDILQADRMRYWLAGWKQSYAMAFDHDDYARDLNEHQCLERIKGLEAFIADREKNEDPGTAQIYANWLKAMVACFELATGRQLDEQRVADEDESVPSPKAMQALPWLARRAKIGRLTGQTPQNGDEGKQVYETWYADWYAKKHAA